MRIRKILWHFSVSAALCFVSAASPFSNAHAAIVAADGGITLWVSWDDLDDPGKDIDEVVNEANSALGGFNCTPHQQRPKRTWRSFESCLMPCLRPMHRQRQSVRRPR